MQDVISVILVCTYTTPQWSKGINLGNVFKTNLKDKLLFCSAMVLWSNVTCLLELFFRIQIRTLEWYRNSYLLKIFAFVSGTSNAMRKRVDLQYLLALDLVCDYSPLSLFSFFRNEHDLQYVSIFDPYASTTVCRVKGGADLLTNAFQTTKKAMLSGHCLGWPVSMK